MTTLAGYFQSVFGEFWSVLPIAALIFFLRVLDMSADTLRILSMVKGHRGRAALLGVFQASVFIYAITEVIRSPTHWIPMAGYALGFGVGTYIGSTIAEWLSSNFVLLRVLSRGFAGEVTEHLRDRGCRVTVVQGHSKDGPMPILFSVVNRDVAREAMATIRQIDDQAFITFEQVERAVGGYIPRLAGWRPAVRR